MKKRSKLEKLTPFVLGTCLLTFVAACGSDDDDNGSNRGAPTQQEDQQREGTFRAILTPVNASLSTNTLNGTATVTIQGDEFTSEVTVDGAPEGTHLQHIHTGTACPTPEADTNNDGFIDAVESAAVSGQILIPFDGDLSTQAGGDNNYPSGSSYDYRESTSYELMLADLRLPDDNTGDAVVKLGANEALNLEGKVVEIHGIPASETLPATVASIDGLTPQQTIPIACGVLTRVEDGGTTTETTGGTTTETTGGTTAGTTGGTTAGTTGGTTAGTTGGTTAGTTGGTTAGTTGGTTDGGTTNGGTTNGGTTNGGTTNGGTTNGGTTDGGTTNGEQ